MSVGQRGDAWHAELRNRFPKWWVFESSPRCTPLASASEGWGRCIGHVAQEVQTSKRGPTHRDRVTGTELAYWNVQRTTRIINNLEVDPAPIAVPIGAVSSSFFDCDLDRDHPLFILVFTCTLFYYFGIGHVLHQSSALYIIEHIVEGTDHVLRTHLQSLASDASMPSHHI